MAYNKTGFHVSQPGNLNGLGDYVRALDAAGIPAVLMGVGGSVGDIIGCWERGSTVPHVVGVRYMPPDGSQDVPPYGSDPRQAAVNWWGWLYPRIGNDVKTHRDKCWIVTGNELDKNQSDWLGRFYVELAGIMHAEGFKLCAFNFAPGEPEPAHWTTPGMLDYLRLCAGRPRDTAVGLHEYSLTDDLQSTYNHLIGRFEALHQVCDERGIRRPTILITEWGWRQESVPAVNMAMAQLPFAAELYARHPNILGAGLWTLQNWHSGCIPNCVQALIAPMTQYSLSAVFPDPPPIDPPDQPDPPPPGSDNLLTNPSFEGGWYHPDGRPEFQIPNQWQFGYDIATPNPYDNNPWSRYVAPEVRVLPANQLPEHERPLFIFDGTYTLKAFKGNGAWWAWFTQEIDLPTGTYTITCPLFADLVKAYQNGQKVWADDPQGRDGQYRIIVGQRGGEWGSLIPGQRNDLVREFAHTGGTITIGLEIRCNFALMNSGIFTDAWSLTAVATEPPPITCPGAAREPYNRVYWVATEANRAAIYDLAATERRTVGPSYDDAGIGVGLSSKTAVAWDIHPSQHQQFIDWYALYYPGTAVQFRYSDGSPSTSPVPTPTSPDPCAGGSAREPYNRVYWVSDDPAVYALAAAEERTVGPSYDDAGIGHGLTSKTAVLWNIPSSRHQEFRDWYALHYPSTAVQFRDIETGFAFTHWPTTERVVTQEFGANPQNYIPFGLPAHEGADIRAASGAPIYAAAPGVVSHLNTNPGASNYGIYIRVDHGNGWETTYAHCQELLKSVGQTVAGGEQIARADNTGNSHGSHLHLTLKRHGHPWTDPAGNIWPYDIQNPTALLAAFSNVTWPGGGPGIPGSEINPPLNPPTPPGYQYNGRAVTFASSIHAPADDWRWPVANGMVSGLGIGVKFLSHGVNADYVGGYAGKFRMCRLFWNNPAGDSKKTPQQKWDQDWKNDFARMYNAGIRIFEIHNEPRLNNEGMGHQWNSAQEWGAWLSGMVDIIRAAYPQALLYYPGESPGVPWTDQFAFTNVAWPMVRDRMHGFCCHAYSGAGVMNTAVSEIVSQVKELQAYLKLQVPLIVSECSVNRGTDYWMKASTYVEVEKQLRGMPGIEGVDWYISDWYNPPPDQAGHGESWYGTPMPGYYDQLN